jgi:PAS domain S-box-containing protein
VASKKTGRCLLVNEAFLSLTGYWRSEVIGSSSIFDRLWASTEERGQTANAHGVPTPADWVRRDGSRRRVLAAMKTAEIDGSEAFVLAGFPVE